MWLDQATSDKRQKFFMYKTVPLKVKGKLYKTVVWLAVMYGPECWEIN